MVAFTDKLDSLCRNAEHAENVETIVFHVFQTAFVELLQSHQLFTLEKRIIGGVEAVANVWPWQVSLQRNGESLNPNSNA